MNISDIRIGMQVRRLNVFGVVTWVSEPDAAETVCVRIAEREAPYDIEYWKVWEIHEVPETQ